MEMARTYNGRFVRPVEPKSSLPFLLGGVALLFAGPVGVLGSIACFLVYGKREEERDLQRSFHEFCAVIGMRSWVPVKELAKISGKPVHKTMRKLQKMIARGYFGKGAYLDVNRNQLVLSSVAESDRPFSEGEGGGSWKDMVFELLNTLRGDRGFHGPEKEEKKAGGFSPEAWEAAKREAWEARQAAQAAQAAQASSGEKQPLHKEEEEGKADQADRKKNYMDELERTLNELLQLNEKIEDEGVSRRIDRIGTLTADIFRVVIEKPEREQDVRKFINYYLPTTLKLLRAYDLLEEQAYQGENIQVSRKKIENVLDMLIEAYEKQLDRLFKNDALDIATDIDVLETMMAGDGLSGKGQMRIP